VNLTLYAIVGGLIAFMGLGLVTYHYRSEAQTAIVLRDAAVRDRDAAVAVNKHNEEVMGRIQAEKDHAEKLAAELADEIDVANNTALSVAKALADLRAKDVDVDAYLKLPVPPALRGVYDRTKAAGGD
jgi:hypothetical protein